MTAEIAEARLRPAGQGRVLADLPQGVLDAARADARSSRSCASSPAASRSASSSASATRASSWRSSRRCSQTGIYADFIVVDGGEGGTGAAPLEFSDSLGAPLNEGLLLVQNTLVGAGLRDQIKIGASGKMVTASAMARVDGARRGLVQLGAGVHVRGRLHPVAALPHQPLPGRA